MMGLSILWKWFTCIEINLIISPLAGLKCLIMIKLYYKKKDNWVYSHTNIICEISDSYLKLKSQEAKTHSFFTWFDISTGNNWLIEKISQKYKWFPLHIINN